MQANVVAINSFSSHADANGLVDYVKSCGDRLKQVFIVHGEEEQSNILRKNIKKLDIKVQVPAKNDIVFLKS